MVELSRCAAVWFGCPFAKRRGRRSDCSYARIPKASESARTPAACHRSTRPTTVISLTGFSIFARIEHPPILLGGRFGRDRGNISASFFCRGIGETFSFGMEADQITVGGILVNRPASAELVQPGVHLLVPLRSAAIHPLLLATEQAEPLMARE